MNVSKVKTATIMNKFTIQQLQQMRESEDHVEFKAGEGGNVSYDGRGKTNPKDRRRCILGYVIALCNEGGGRLVIGMHDNYPHRVTGTRQSQDAIGQLESDIYRDTTIRPEIYELYDEEKRRVLVIEVPSRPIGKVFKFEDVPLMRVGEELKPMSDAVYLKILQESEPDFSEKSGSDSCNILRYMASDIGLSSSPTRINGTSSNLKTLPIGREGTSITKTRCFSSS